MNTKEPQHIRNLHKIHTKPKQKKNYLTRCTHTLKSTDKRARNAQTTMLEPNRQSERRIAKDRDRQ